MGDIKRIRKKYSTPGHPWNKERIDAEKRYMREYGLTNKKELWKTDSTLKYIKDQIKRFPSMTEEQAAEQTTKLRGRLRRLGLIDETTPLGTVLGYDSEVILDRRLQTVVFKKGLARTIKQARQMITHEHITVGGRTVNAPGYLVPLSEEPSVSYHGTSAFMNDLHPERIQEEKPRPRKEKRTKQDEEDVPVVELQPEDEDV